MKINICEVLRIIVPGLSSMSVLAIFVISFNFTSNSHWQYRIEEHIVYDILRYISVFLENLYVFRL